MASQTTQEERGVERGEATRTALIAAATRVFADKGFHGVSTRALAAEAEVNQALIGYHFGGKEGLYLAVFTTIVGEMRTRLEPVANLLREQLAAELPGLDAAARRAHYLTLLHKFSDAMLAVILRDDTRAWSQLIMREQQSPGKAFDLLYEGFMKQMLSLLTAIMQRLLGDTAGETSRLMVITIFGQILVWRVAREAIMRQMGWTCVAEEEYRQIREIIHRNITAQTGARTEGGDE